MWKTKALIVLESMDYEMLVIVNHGPHIPMYQSMDNNAPAGGLKQKPKASYNEEDKRHINQDVNTRATIGNSFPCHIYRLVQNYESTQEMMKMVTVAYDEETSSKDEGIKEKCLMAHIDDFHIKESDTSSDTSNVDLSQATRDSKSQDWDSSSIYQVKKIFNYSSNEKVDMFDYLLLDLAKSNSEKFTLKLEIKVLKEKLIAIENSLSLSLE